MPQFYCDDPAVPAWRANLTPTTYCCVECDAEFLSCQARAFYCSPKCRGAAVSRKLKARVELARAAKERICAHCEKRFRPSRPNQQQKAAGYVQQCCSSACASALRAKPKLIRKCRSCDTPLTGRSPYCSDACRPPPAYTYTPVPPREIAAVCRVCSGLFVYQKSGRGGLRSICSEQCAHVVEVSRRKRAKVKRRKARSGEQFVETVISTKVFDRDGWRCQECRRRTPRKLRGTTDPRAPELDHIVSVADGGEHSYRNTQCLCRACNAAKGRASRGQFALL